MADLIHGGDIYSVREKGKGEEILDFSANINPLGMPEGVKEAVIKGLSDCVHYPDPLSRQLVRELAAHEGAAESHIVCGNGAADLIFRLVVAKMPYKALVTAPTFAEYEKALESVGCIVEHHLLKERDGFRLGDDILFALNDSLDMVFLCNPNNPTGQLIDGGLLLKILDRCREKKILLVLDECFIDFLEDPEKTTMKGYTGMYDNLFILRAFTKNYAMPGLRLGYCLCGDKQLLATLRETGQPWSVSLPAQLAGVQALKEKEYLRRSRELIFQEREYLAKQLAARGLNVYPPAANYIFFQLPADTFVPETFKSDMEEEGILVRSCSNYVGLNETFFRVAVKTRTENDRLLAGLDQIRKG